MIVSIFVSLFCKTHCMQSCSNITSNSCHDNNVIWKECWFRSCILTVKIKYSYSGKTSTLSKTHCSRGVWWGDFLKMAAYSGFSLLSEIFQFLCSIFRNYEVIARSENHQTNCLNSMVKLTNTV